MDDFVTTLDFLLSLLLVSECKTKRLEDLRGINFLLEINQGVIMSSRLSPLLQLSEFFFLSQEKLTYLHKKLMLPEFERQKK